MEYRRHMGAAAMLLALCLPACSGGPGPMYPVEGTVTLDGKPFTKGFVVFWPDSANGNTSAFPCRSEISESGAYALYMEGMEGAPVGPYKVTVTAEVLADSTTPEKTKSLVPEKYTQRETTPLAIRVVDDPASGAYDLRLKSSEP